MITPNDTVLTRDDKKTTLLSGPTTNEKEKKDIRHPRKRKIKRVAKPVRIYCQLCGHEIPLSDNQAKTINSKLLSNQAKLQARHMGRRERHRRAVLAGLARAQKAGQKLKPSTIQKCTGRKIYKQAASKLQIKNSSTSLV